MDTFTIGNIGVGPIFSTQTKPNANPVGISYIYWAKQFSKAPIVAVGGIKTTISEITESDNIQNTIYELMMGYSRVR